MENEKIFLDEVMRVHEQYDAVNKRVTKLEEQKRSSFRSDDPLSGVILWVAAAYVASLLLPIVIGLWRGER